MQRSALSPRLLFCTEVKKSHLLGQEGRRGINTGWGDYCWEEDSSYGGLGFVLGKGAPPPPLISEGGGGGLEGAACYGGSNKGSGRLFFFFFLPLCLSLKPCCSIIWPQLLIFLLS